MVSLSGGASAGLLRFWPKSRLAEVDSPSSAVGILIDHERDWKLRSHHRSALPPGSLDSPLKVRPNPCDAIC